MNVLVHVRFIRRALPGMLERGWGRIVNVASTAGRQPDDQLPTLRADQGGAHQLEQAARERVLAARRAHQLRLPRHHAHGGGDGLGGGADGPHGDDPARVFDEYFGARRPLPAGRFGEPEDTAALVAFLCSDARRRGSRARASTSTAGGSSRS